ncbi:MAG: hypothetical protein HW387_1223 [Parachlamydiales bacterium]|nr:hypothetical protein [Parachlamydiales bacterium]
MHTNHITRKSVVINEQYLQDLDQQITKIQRQFDEQQKERAESSEQINKLLEESSTDIAIDLEKSKKTLRKLHSTQTYLRVALITALAITCLLLLNRHYGLSSVIRKTLLNWTNNNFR